MTNKICPFCKSKIEPGDAAIMCPSCGIPHHRGCWDTNNGCTTFGCSEKRYDIKNTYSTRACNGCGNPLIDGQDFCPKCGQRVTTNELNADIIKYNQSIIGKKKKKKVFPIVLSIFLVVVAIVGLYEYKEIQNRKQREKYIDDAAYFSAAVINASVNVEDVVDTIQRYWYESIWEDKYDQDIDKAIETAMSDKWDEISDAIGDKAEIDDLYGALKKVPENISDYEIININIAVKELYNVYCEFYDMAIMPDGSYNTYSEDNEETTDELISKLEALNLLLD